MTHVEVLERDGDGSDARRKRDRRHRGSCAGWSPFQL
jgi:hypothetical protein